MTTTFIEDYAETYQISVPAGSRTPVNYVEAIRKMIQSNVGTHFWEVDTANSPSLQGVFVIKPKTGESVNTRQQITFRGSSTDKRIYIGYAPEGGVNLSSWTNIETPINSTAGATNANTYSGESSITGNTTTDLGTFNTLSGIIYLAEYRDMNPVYGMELSCSLTIFIDASNSTHHPFGCHVGRVIAPDNASDPDNDIHGDAILIGIPSNSSSAAHWLLGSGANTGSRVRIGAVMWDNLATTGIFAAGSAVLARTLTKDRLVPLTIYGLNSGEIGRTKYLRQFRANLPNGAKLPSADNVSQQAWQAWQHVSGTQHNHIILWKKGSPAAVQF